MITRLALPENGFLLFHFITACYAASYSPITFSSNHDRIDHNIKYIYAYQFIKFSNLKNSRSIN